MKNKTTAAILAFFLGTFGVHRFYLGQGGLGIVYLFLCWTTISIWISIIDAISFLVMNEDNFNLKYNRLFVPGNHSQPMVIIQNVQGDYSSNSSPANIGIHDVNKETPFKTKGDKMYAEYDLDGAIKEYQRSLKVKSNDPEVHFKLACLFSLLEQSDVALYHLNKALEQGYSDFNAIKTNDHLAFLRTTEAYSKFVQNNFKASIPLTLLQVLPPENIISQIEKWVELKNKGALTEEEFNQQKGKLLGN